MLQYNQQHQYTPCVLMQVFRENKDRWDIYRFFDYSVLLYLSV